MASSTSLKIHERRIRDAIADVRRVVSKWPDTHPSKESALDRADELERLCNEYSGHDKILNLRYPETVGTNVIWNNIK